MPRRPRANPPRSEVLALLEECKRTLDDTPRLILADWLEERGDPRGEFVRIQCQRARLSEADPRSAELAQREEELLAEHRDAWLGILAERGILADFQGGLVRASGRAGKLLSKRLAALPPTESLAWVERLRIYDADIDAVARLAASPHWTCLGGLALSGFMYYADHLSAGASAGMGPKGGVAVAALPLLSRLTELDLDCNDISAEGVAALAARPDLTHLRILSLHGNNLRDQGAAALASCRSLLGLVELNLSQNRMGSKGFAALARWPGLAKVATLNVGGNYPGAEGVAALAASPHLNCLTELRLWAPDNLGRWANPGPYRSGVEGAKALAESTCLRRLTLLQLTGNGVGPEGAAALAASRKLPELTDLDLSDNRVGDAGAIALASSPRSRRLARLDLRSNGISDEGAMALASSPHLAGLKEISVVANRDISVVAEAALLERFGGALRR